MSMHAVAIIVSVGKNNIKPQIEISSKLTINCYYAAANSA